MKRIFIAAKVKREPDYLKLKNSIKEIPEKNIAICYSNQFVEVAKKLEKILDKNIVYKTQILGCSNPSFPKETQAIVAITEGKFHSVSLAYESKLPTYALEGNKIQKVSEELIEKRRKKEKGAYLKFLNANNIGILVSTKPGQERLQKAIQFSKKITNKKSYIFVANDLNSSEFENFQIETWVNTACPRMDLTDDNIMNLDKLEELQKEK